MCEFCESLKFKKEMQRRFNKRDKEIIVKPKYSVAIVTRDFIKGLRGERGKTTDYRHMGCGYKINYCPECGLKMSKG